MQCIVLAGGLATRMRPLTSSLPKNLIPIGGLPFAGYQLSWLRDHGVDRLVYAIGHLGEQIRDFVGDGRRWRMEVSYVDEGEHLRGTGGALRLALGESKLEESFLVTWGDAFLPIDFEAVWRQFLTVDEPALMTVFHNRERWGRSNVRYAAGKVSLYESNAAAGRTPGMEYIDYGLLALNRNLVAERIPPERVFDLGDLCHDLSLEGSLAGFEVAERFYEIGSPEGLRDFEAWVEAHPR